MTDQTPVPQPGPEHTAARNEDGTYVNLPAPAPKRPRRKLAAAIVGIAALVGLTVWAGIEGATREQQTGRIVADAVVDGTETPLAKRSGELDRTPALQGQVADLEAEVADLTADVATLTEERDTLQATSDVQAERIGELEDQLAAALAEPEPAADTLTAGDYSFADVQVSEDFAGDFELRSRVTNGGDSVEFATWTATLFLDGTVVADLMGTADSFNADETVTVTFIGTDDFGDWDSVEFQVDSEW